jgi:PAS domain S-box-containing protein
MMGYAQDELLQKSFKDLTHPDDISASSKLMKQLRSGEIPTFTTEKRYIRKDKSIMWGSVSVKGIQDNSGQTVSFLAMLEDISARKNSEAELAKERQRIQVLMDTIPDSVYFKDVNSRFTSVNRATALKFGSKDPVELIGKSDHDYFNEYAAIQADKDEEKIVRSGDPIIGLEEQEIWPDKPPRWVSTTKMALKDENGNITGTFGVIRDITERKQQEEEIKRLNADLEKKVEQRTKELRLKNQELESFTYTVSHDLKAPLRGISGYADLLLQDHAGQLDEEGKSFLQKLIKSSIQLSQLIEDLLVYSRLERRPVTLENLKVNEIIDLVLEQRGQEIKNRNVAMHIDVVDETIKSSHELVTQIIMNYVDNALKFTSQCEVPEIWVNYANLGKTSLLSIKDNGVGFDAKYKDKIFEVFQRLQTTDVYPGTGIGLALVKKAAELLGYKVWAESEPGKGATFYLEIAK